MTVLLNYFRPLLKTFLITGCFPFKKSPDSITGFKVINTKYYILVPIFLQVLSMGLAVSYQSISQATDKFDSAFILLAIEGKSSLDSGLFYCLALSVIFHYIINGLIWKKRQAYLSLMEYLEQFKAEREKFGTENLLIIFSILSWSSGMALQLVWMIYRIFKGESINAGMFTIEIVLFIFQAYVSNAPIYSFIIMYGNVCSNIKLILKKRMEMIQIADIQLQECEKFFINAIRKTNDIFSPFLFYIIGPYLLIFTFGSYSALFSVLSIESMNLKDICFGLSQVLLSFFVISIVFMINYFSNDVTNTFLEYKVSKFDSFSRLSEAFSL